MADVSFNVANPYQTQLDELARRQKMAEIMQQQSLQPLERYSYQGIEAPISPLSGLAKALQGYMSGRNEGKIAEERKTLGEKYQSDLMSTLNRANELAMGKPATPFDASEFGGQSVGKDDPELTGINPAVASDRDAAAREYFKHPATQAMGITEMQKNAQLQRLLRAGEPQATTGATTTPAAGGTSLMGVSNVKPITSSLSRWGQPAGGQPMSAWLETDPSGKSYIEQLAKESLEANKPTDTIRNLRAAGVIEGSPQWNAALTNINTAGGIFQPNAQGGVGLAPGFAEGVGLIKTSETEATSRNAISTREVGGRNVTGTDRQFNILANGIAPTDQEAQSVAEWADRNGIKVAIKGPRSQMPWIQTAGEPQSAGVKNPTPAEAAQAKEFATAGASGITKKLETSYDLAKNSVERISTLNDLKTVIDLPAFSGPGASAQLTLGQLANKFYGANNSEVLANTTLKMQGLADLSLKAAGLIKGQGTITEPERALLARAKSAPENLTVPEYKALFKIFERQDAEIIKEHKNVVKRAKKAGVQNTDFYSVDVPIPSGLNLSPEAKRLLGQ